MVVLLENHLPFTFNPVVQLPFEHWQFWFWFLIFFNSSGLHPKFLHLLKKEPLIVEVEEEEGDDEENEVPEEEIYKYRNDESDDEPTLEDLDSD